MRALRALRANNRQCCPSVVKSLMGVQKRHRMAFAALNAATAELAGQALEEEGRKEAATLAVRRSQAKASQELRDRGAERAARKRRKNNSGRDLEKRKQAKQAKAAKEAEEEPGGVEEAPA